MIDYLIMVLEKLALPKGKNENESLPHNASFKMNLDFIISKYPF